MRLIDADELKKCLPPDYVEMDGHCVKNGILKVVDAAPTIDQWHYPSKGENPPEGEEILFRSNGQNYLGTYSKISNYFDSRDMGGPASCVDCWQYIIPPKEKA